MIECFYKEPQSSFFDFPLPIMSEATRQEAIDNGIRHATEDGGTKLTFYYYKDNWYLTDYEEINNVAP